jgi:hypothetical protein
MKTTNDRTVLEKESDFQVKPNLEEEKLMREKGREIDYRYECDSGVCFESGV